MEKGVLNICVVLKLAELKELYTCILSVYSQEAFQRGAIQILYCDNDATLNRKNSGLCGMIDLVCRLKAVVKVLLLDF